MTDRGYLLRARLNVSLGLEREIARALVDAAHQICLSSKATCDNITSSTWSKYTVHILGIRYEQSRKKPETLLPAALSWFFARPS